MPFQSILYSNKPPELHTEAPSCFHDLHINKITAALLTGMEAYQLAGFYYSPLNNTTDIIFRQEVFQDMENPALLTAVKRFAQSMFDMRALLAQSDKCSYGWQQKSFFLESVNLYSNAVDAFTGSLKDIDLKAGGFLQLREYLYGYVPSATFTTLTSETRKLLKDLSSIRYAIILKDLRVQVRNYNNESDFSREVSQTLDKFKQGPVKDYRAKFEWIPEMNHVEADILDGVVTLYPELFRELDTYCNRHAGYLDSVIAGFDREVHFYISWLHYTEKLKKAGLPFCFPEILTNTKEVCSYNGFDLALANALVSQNLPVICNDFYLDNKERIIIVSGPNQGGKTTFARTFGQLHYFACLGLTVPGTSTRLFLYDKIFTHFEKEEDLSSRRSKFEDDLFRIHEILIAASSRSIVIFNEILSSTTLQDALLLSRKVMNSIDALDCLCIWITFMDELIGYSSKTVSMVSTIAPGSPSVRTFKITRKAADGLAYALTIAEKYRVTYSWLKKRLSR